MANQQHFFADLDAFLALVALESRAYVRAVVGSVFTDIVMETPFDTGRAKAGWAVALGAPALETAEDVTATDRLSAQDAEARAFATLQALIDFELGEVITISNGVPYISALEEGHSQQSRHMVARALAKEVGQSRTIRGSLVR